MNGSIVAWLIISLLFLIAELGSPGFFFFFSFFIASLITAISAIFVSNLMIQLFVFLGGTILSFLCLQIWVRFRGSRISKKQATNMDALIGKVAVAVKSVDSNNPGYVRLQGVLWVARPVNNDVISEGTLVEIVDVQGSHLIVKKSVNKL